MTTLWTTDELQSIDAADELDIAPRRRDGTLRRPVPIWVVRHGDDLYVRSVRGRDGGWFPAAEARHEGHVEAGGVGRDVEFDDVGDTLADDIDAAYREKYRRYSASVVDSVVGPVARAATLRLVPRN